MCCQHQLLWSHSELQSRCVYQGPYQRELFFTVVYLNQRCRSMCVHSRHQSLSSFFLFDRWQGTLSHGYWSKQLFRETFLAYSLRYDVSNTTLNRSALSLSRLPSSTYCFVFVKSNRLHWVACVRSAPTASSVSSPAASPIAHRHTAFIFRGLRWRALWFGM